ncbi:MAG: hypothetical protein JXR96_07100 [Deltaproteobacteria bacterium]|nr:hypothetical protein [Deltaproteobacteria bacterium]
MLRRLLTCLTMLSVLPAAALAEDKVPVAVMEFATKGGVTQGQMDALSDMLANEIRALGKYKVIGKNDIRNMLRLEQQKAMLGCTDDSCLAELGGALGVRWVVVGNISQFGSTYLLNLKLLDAEQRVVTGALSRKIKGGEEALLDGLSSAAKELFGHIGARLAGDAGAPKPPPADPPPADQGSGSTGTSASSGGDGASGTQASATSGGASASGDDAGAVVVVDEQAAGKPMHPYVLWGHVSFWSGAGLVALGGLSFYLSWRESRAYFNDDSLGAADASRQWAGAAWTSMGLGAALLATGATLWLLAPDDAEISAVAAPAPGGVVMAVGGRW